MFKLLNCEHGARRGVLYTPHGKVDTPLFMNVATAGAIKGGVSSIDLKDLKCQVMLCNTYHLHLRPSEEVINKLGGLSKFTGFDGPILTDSGGFQVFSLASLNKIEEEGVVFTSHIDGERIFLSPETSIGIQSKLGSTIAMAFDECVKNPAEYDYVKASGGRTLRWLKRSFDELKRLNSMENTINKKQYLFGINQGSTFGDLRIENMKQITDIDCDGYAIGGLAVGEPKEQMYEIIEKVTPFMPKDKPRYLMGVGKPSNILEAVKRGIDMFDCVMPTRNGRHGHLNTLNGVINLNNAKHSLSDRAIDDKCDCFVCRNYSRGYIRHLIKSKEALGYRLAASHNLYFYNTLMEKIRDSIEKNNFEQFYKKYVDVLDLRI